MKMHSTSTAAVVALSFSLLLSVALAATFAEPPTIHPDANGITSVTVTVDVARIQVNDTVTFNTRAYHIDGQPIWPGPILHLKPGGSLNFTLINNLGAELTTTGDVHNTFHHLNTTNLHTHGLHVTPYIDSVFTRVAPGGRHTYLIPLPANHAPGTHWFHAHVHGSTTFQVTGGLVGTLIVDKPDNTVGLPTELASLDSHHALVHFLPFVSRNGQSCSPNTQTPRYNPFLINTMDEIATEAGYTTQMTNAVHNSGTAADYFLVNGMRAPQLTVRPGQRKIIRMVYGAASMAGSITMSSSVCVMHTIAFDGVYISGAPRAQTRIDVTSATRVDIVVMCSAAGTYTMNVASGGVNQALITFVSSGEAVVQNLPTTLDTITRPNYLNSLLTATPNRTGAIHLGQGGKPECKSWMAVGTNCDAYANTGRGGTQPSTTDPQCPFKVFPGERGTTEANHDFVATVGEIVDFKVYGGGNEPHPLHIHVNHFQIVQQPSANNYFQVGDWRDTMPVLGTTLVRFPADELDGEIIMHCHFLPHEDKGLMSSFLIKKPDGQSGTPAPVTAPTPAPGTASTPAPAANATTPTPATTATTPTPNSPAAPLQCTSSTVGELVGGFRITGTAFSGLLDGSTKQTSLMNSLRKDISAVMTLSETDLCINQLTLGSLIVNYTITNAQGKEGAVSSLMNVAASNGNAGWLTNTRTVYTSNGGTDTFTVDSVVVTTSSGASTAAVTVAVALMVILAMLF